MTQVDESKISENKERPLAECYDPWEQMFKTHFEAPKLDSQWTAPATEEEPV